MEQARSTSTSGRSATYGSTEVPGRRRDELCSSRRTWTSRRSRRRSSAPARSTPTLHYWRAGKREPGLERRHRPALAALRRARRIRAFVVYDPDGQRQPHRPQWLGTGLAPPARPRRRTGSRRGSGLRGRLRRLERTRCSGCSARPGTARPPLRERVAEAASSSRPRGSELLVQRSIGSWWKKKFGEEGQGGDDSEISGPDGRSRDDRGGAGRRPLHEGADGAAREGEERLELDQHAARRPRRRPRASRTSSASRRRASRRRASRSRRRRTTSKALRGHQEDGRDPQGPERRRSRTTRARSTPRTARRQPPIALWKQSPRRLAGAPEDKPKLKEIEALLQDLKWTRDKSKADGAATAPEPGAEVRRTRTATSSRRR